MGQRKTLTDLQVQAVKLLTGLSGFSNARVAETLLPAMGGIDLATLYMRIRRLQKQEGRRQNTPRAPASEPGTFALHGTTIAYAGRPYSLLIIMELHTGWLWARVLPHTRIDLQKIVEGLYEVLGETAIGDARLSLKEIILLCFETRNRTAIKKVVLVEDALEPTWFPTIIRKPDEVLAKDLRAGLKPWHKQVSISAALLPEEFRKAEPLELPGEGLSRAKLDRAVKKFVENYNNAERKTFPRTKEPVVPSERLYEALREKQINSKRWRLPPRGES